MSTLAVGLMSGTSLDGVDAALVRLDPPDRLELVAFRSEPYDPAFRSVLSTALVDGSPRELARLNVELGERFADATEAVLAAAGIEAGEIAFAASHGQTIWHEPGRATLQLGDPAVVAERLGVPVVSDFRSRDVAAGGQGAPLVPLADAVLFGHAEHGRALLNLGGMANVTWVERRGELGGVLAFDTGPGVAVIDAIVRRLAGRPFDLDGGMASRGTVCESVVTALLAHPFFEEPPPRSTGRESFGERFAADLVERVRSARPGSTVEDAVATAVALTARSVARGIEDWLPAEARGDLILSGGGARNPVLRAAIVEAIVDGRVRTFDEVFFDGDAKEAAVFAYLGWRTIRGEPGNVPTATGAAGPRVLGRITPA